MQTNQIKEIVEELIKQNQQDILGQLEYLVDKGLLTIQRGEMRLVQEQWDTKIRVCQAIALRVKGQERIEQLEQQVAELQQRLDGIAHAVRPYYAP
jgi:hypothetical protein